MLITIVAVALIEALRVALVELFDINAPWFIFLLPVAAGVVAATIQIRSTHRGQAGHK